MKLRRLAALFLAFVMLITLAACGSSGGGDSDSGGENYDYSDAYDESGGDAYDEAYEYADDYSDDYSDDSSYDEDYSDDAAYDDSDYTQGEQDEPSYDDESAPLIDEDGSYTSKDDVALYIHTYGHLPGNFITKKEARELGWSGGGLEKYAPGMCIGGDRFGNYEGLLPEKKGRKYTECDIDTLGAKSRGAKRIVFSNDGLIYYTDDHYDSFTLLYGEE